MSWLDAHLLTVVTFLPLAAGLLLLLLRNLPEQTWKVVALAASALTFAISLKLWLGYDPTRAGYQFVEYATWLPSWGVHYFVGIDGMRLLMVRAHHVPDAAGADRGVERPEEAGEELRVPQPLPRDGHARRVRRAEPVPVLRVLGDHAGPDVLHHRDLGRAAARLRGGEVLPVHDGRLAADAGRGAGALLAAPAAVRRSDLRPRAPHAGRRPGAARHQRPARRSGDLVEDAAVALRGVRARLRHQGADGAVPHLAARRAHRGADGGLGDPRRRAAEDGHLRLRALRAAALPGRRRTGGAS